MFLDEYNEDMTGRFSKITKYIKLQSRMERVVFCLESLKSLGNFGENRKKAQLYLSLYESMIISYGSCFAKVDGGGQAKLERGHVFREKEELKLLHDQIIHLRNELVAHNGKTDHFKGKCKYMEYEDRIELIIIAEIQTPQSQKLESYTSVIEHVWNHIKFNFEKSLKDTERAIGKTRLERL
jgi:hypothetical protein